MARVRTAKKSGTHGFCEMNSMMTPYQGENPRAIKTYLTMENNKSLKN